MSDLALLRAVIAHARTNGWTHDITDLSGLPRDHRWQRDGAEVNWFNACLYVNNTKFRPTSVRQAVNLLVDLDVLPVTLHSAYAAGQAAAEEPSGWFAAGYFLHKTCGAAERYDAPPRYCVNCRDVDDAWWPLYTWDAPEPAPVAATVEPGRTVTLHLPLDGCDDCVAALADVPEARPTGVHPRLIRPLQAELGIVPELAAEEPARTLTAVERDAEQYIAPLGVGEPWHDPNAELLRVEGGE